jgi:hypothetical protein
MDGNMFNEIKQLQVADLSESARLPLRPYWPTIPLRS